MTAEGPGARKRPDDHLLDEAAEWIGRLRAPDVDRADRQAFSRWLARSPAHRAAFDTMADLFDGLGVLAAGSEVRAASPTDAALQRHRPLAAVAATVLLAMAALLFVQWPGDGELTFQTARGEIVEHRLPDGSLAQLNTATSISWTDTDGSRRIDVALGGEVFVDVVSDPSRPFEIHTDHGIARAVGTAFAVRAEAARTTVTVVEGRVDVRAPGTAADADARSLGAGELIDVTAGAALAPVRSAAAQTLGWLTGQLVYDDVALAELVEDLNRYLPLRMTISDDELAATRVSAVLRLGSQEAMLEALAQVLPLAWVRLNEQVLVIHPV